MLDELVSLVIEMTSTLRAIFQQIICGLVVFKEIRQIVIIESLRLWIFPYAEMLSIFK